MLLDIKKIVKRAKYRREAKKHNARARLLRLQKTDWYGFPLPTGKRGTLRLTYEDMVTAYNTVSLSQMERAYHDRGLDLKVDVEVIQEFVTKDILVRWQPHKGRWPKERY